MESNLRPLSLGEILDRTAQLYRTNFLLFAGISAVYAGVAMALNLLLFFPLRSWSPESMTDPAHLGKFFTAYGVVLLLLFLLYGATTAATTRAVAWVHLGEPATIRRAYSSTLPRLGRYLWLKVIVVFMIFLVGLAALIGAAILAVVLSVILLAGTHPSPGITIVIVLLMYASIGFLTIWMGLRYSLAIPASVVENLKARKAIRRSIELSKGSRGRIFVLWLLVGIIWIALFLITNIYFFIYSAMHNDILPIGLGVLQQVLSFLLNTFVVPISTTGITLFYYDQRVRKEGYDIEWMMQAAGLTALPPAVLAEHLAAAGEEPWPHVDSRFEPRFGPPGSMPEDPRQGLGNGHE
jgi:hypothetical protein